MTKTEERLADALAARADAVDASSVRPLPEAELAGADRGSRRSWWLAPLAAAASVAIVAAVIAVVSGTARPGPLRSSPARLPVAGMLTSVSALSANDVWAVGWQETPRTSYSNIGFVPFIVHWDGTKWQRVKAPPEPQGARLSAVAASSPDDVWAVGTSRSFNTPLILHWNGKSWRQERFAVDNKLGQLLSVTAITATDAWAVGAAGQNGGGLILHWNGVTWAKVGVPSVARGPDTFISKVAATSASNIWAVGNTERSNLALHWDGRTWSATRLPNLRSAVLGDAAAGPGGTVWATAYSITGLPARPVMLRWNGTAWQRAPGPDLATSDPFWLAVAGPDSVWAVGGEAGGTGNSALIFHWNGSSWTPARLKLTGDLSAVTAISASSAWAVGYLGQGGADTPIVLHWNGSTWRQVYGSATTGGLLQNSSCGPFQQCAEGSAHKAGHG